MAQIVENSEVEVISFDQKKLKGSLVIPPNVNSVFIPLHESFVQNRDGDLDGTKKWMFPNGVPSRKLFLDIANELAKSGAGSFRFDKRASGDSEGDYIDTDLTTLAKDAEAVLKYIKQRFPNIPVGFIGQSEGSLVALKEYEFTTKPDFLVLQGPLLDPIASFLEYQRTHAAAPFLNDQSGMLANQFPYLSAFYNAAYHGDLMERLTNSNDKYYTLRLANWTNVTSLQKYREYGWNGFEMLKSVKCPTLIVIGSQDQNVNPATVKKIVDQKSSGQFSNVSVEILDGLEHSFRQILAGESFVTAMSKPVAPNFLEVVRNKFTNIATSCNSKLAVN